MLSSLKKHFAIRSYRKKLGTWLEEHHGWRATYSPAEVRAGVARLGLATASISYAYAMYCTRSDFDEHHAAAGESCNYDAMRTEVSRIDASGDSFPGTDGAGSGDGDYGDGGGGDFSSGDFSGGYGGGGGDGGGGGA